MNNRTSVILKLALFGITGAGQVFSQEDLFGRAEAQSADLNRVFSFDDFHQSGSSWSRRAGYSQPLDGVPQPDSDVLANIQVKWGNTEIDPLGESLTVRGQLQIPSPTDANQLNPIDWQQGITVAVSKYASEKSRVLTALTSDQCRMKTCLTDAHGHFQVKFNLENLERDETKEAQFRCAIALATHSQRGRDNRLPVITWRSEDEIHEKSTNQLTVPANPPLDPVINLIRLACTDREYDPRAIIRAVNTLQPLGKDAALESIERFLRMKEQSDGQTSIGCEGVFWILRVMFEPIDFGKRIPPPDSFVNLVSGRAATHWPLNPIVVVGDIPFSVGVRIGGSGTPENPQNYIEFVRRHCVLRDAALRPHSNAMELAEQLIASPLIAGMSEQEKSSCAESIRKQAAKMKTQ